jgi:signal transduction histidine kinase
MNLAGTLEALKSLSPAVAASLNFREDRFRRRLRLLLWVGFGGLLLLMTVIGLSAVSFLYQIQHRQEQIREQYVERDRILAKLRSDIYLSGTYVRDFLLDNDETLARTHKNDFVETRERILAGDAEYRRLVHPADRASFQDFERELNAYFAILAPTLSWTAAERQQKGYSFIREEVLPRRMNMVSLADRIQEVSQRELEASSQQIGELFASFRLKLLIMLLLTVAVGIALAGATLWRVLHLERESQMRFEEVARARNELQQLSAELLSAQESERRRIARELHDEVGQALWAMMLGLGNLRSALEQDKLDEARRQLQMVQEVAEKNAAVVRNISLLLRPSMLDDLGLVPALKWLAREVSRTTPLEVEVIAGNFSRDLPEDHKTCVFRVVQEAIRNVSRHAGARQAKVKLEESSGRLLVTIQDDGSGFEPSQEKGMGMLGMEERVARLGGAFRVDSRPGRGATITFELPLAPVFYETSPLRTA